MQVLLCGIEAHVCILQTTLDLLQRGYEVHLLVDGISSQRGHDRAVALQRMSQAGERQRGRSEAHAHAHPHARQKLISDGEIVLQRANAQAASCKRVFARRDTATCCIMQPINNEQLVYVHV